MSVGWHCPVTSDHVCQHEHDGCVGALCVLARGRTDDRRMGELRAAPAPLEYCVYEWEYDSSGIDELLADGWRPQGGVAVIRYEGYNHETYWLYAQALVREKTPPTGAVL
jgi:hypothetical protein